MPFMLLPSMPMLQHHCCIIIKNKQQHEATKTSEVKGRKDELCCQGWRGDNEGQWFFDRNIDKEMSFMLGKSVGNGFDFELDYGMA